MCRPGYVLSHFECHEGKLNVMYVVYKGEGMFSFSDFFSSRKKKKARFYKAVRTFYQNIVKGLEVKSFSHIFFLLFSFFLYQMAEIAFTSNDTGN